MAQTWTVTDMTCEHCVASVSEEVSALAGVRRVDVALATGALTVEAEPPCQTRTSAQPSRRRATSSAEPP